MVTEGDAAHQLTRAVRNVEYVNEDRGAAHQLSKAQRTIEYGLALAVPLLLTLMLYSYIIYNPLFTPLFIATVVFAGLMIIPAYRALNLHFDCWAPNVMPQKMVTGLVGTIYISAASVFGVSIMSVTKALDPQQPLTFAVLALFAMLLIVVMGYNSRFKAQNERTDIRFFRHEQERLASLIKDTCDAHQVGYKVIQKGKVTIMDLTENKVLVTIRRQPLSGNEVMLECRDPIGKDLCSTLKQSLDRTA
jgi:hypothetical protein